MLRKWLLMLAVVALFTGATTAAQAEDALKLGTLAPRDSPWGQVFTLWGRAVSQKSGGDVTLDWAWNAQAGDENQMVSSMRSGVLHGAAITAVGLGQIYPSILVFQMPGVFGSWEKLDGARHGMRRKIEAKFEAQGFKILGFGDVGAGKIMSIGMQVAKPSDLTKGGTYYVSGDPIGPALFAAVGGVNAKQLSVPEILPALGSSVQIINAPALAAEQLQWASRITHINTMTTGYGIGALVFSAKAYEGLSEEVRKLLRETGEVAARNLTGRIRALDAQAFGRLKNNKTAYEVTDADRAEWDAKFAATRAALRNRPFDGDIFDEAIRLGR